MSSMKSPSERMKRPRGSPRRESNPAERMTKSGRKASMAGMSFLRKASRMGPRPVPAGKGQLRVVDLPAAAPVSEESPVPGYQGAWWTEKKKTWGSS